MPETRPTRPKKKNLLECPFKRVQCRTVHVFRNKVCTKKAYFCSQNSCHILFGKSTLSISNLKWWKTPTQNRTGSVFEKNCYRWKNTIRFLGKWVHTHTKLNIFAGRLCRPKEMARVKFQTKSPRRILSGNVGRLCVALWKSEYESQDEGGRGEDKIMMLNHVQGDLGNPSKTT